MIYLDIILIWYLLYLPFHNKMPWSYKKWQARQKLNIKPRKRDWE